MADPQRQDAEFVAVRRDDLIVIFNAANLVTKWSPSEWEAVSRLWDAIHNDGAGGDDA